MNYMGSKRKYCKYIVPIIQKYINENNITTFVDCFCGGANLADNIQCENVICNDLSPTLIDLHKQAQKDFSKIPSEGSREYWDLAYAEWKRLVTNPNYKPLMPLFVIGAIEWYGSFCCGGFPRGYAKNFGNSKYYQENYNSHKKQVEKENYKKIQFICGSYDKIPNLSKENTLLYCDSPYKGTTPYGIDKNFNFYKYYQWLIEMSRKYPIFISEQKLPPQFNDFIIWEKNDVKRTTRSDNGFVATEKLYLLGS